MVFNLIIRRGFFLGNLVGVVVIVYNCVNLYIGYVRGKYDVVNMILVGGISGVIFKSIRGFWLMMILGGFVVLVVGFWVVSFFCVLIFILRRLN